MRLLTPNPSILLEHETVRELVKRIEQNAPPYSYSDMYAPVISEVALWHGTLPLSTEVWAEEMGALRASLTAGLLSLQYAKQSVFAVDQPPEVRHRLVPEYAFLSFLGAVGVFLLWPSARFFVELEGGLEWKPLSCGRSLAAHMLDENASSAVARRREMPLRDTLGRASAGMSAFVNGATLRHNFAPISERPMAEFWEALAPSPTLQVGETVLAKAIRQGVYHALELDQRKRRHTISLAACGEASSSEDLTPNLPVTAQDGGRESGQSLVDGGPQHSQSSEPGTLPVEAPPLPNTAKMSSELKDVFFLMSLAVRDGKLAMDTLRNGLEFSVNALKACVGLPIQSLASLLRDAGMLVSKDPKSIVIALSAKKYIEGGG